jgi:hypothetical protein
VRFCLSLSSRRSSLPTKDRYPGPPRPRLPTTDRRSIISTCAGLTNRLSPHAPAGPLSTPRPRPPRTYFPLPTFIHHVDVTRSPQSRTSCHCTRTPGAGPRPLHSANCASVSTRSASSPTRPRTSGRRPTSSHSSRPPPIPPRRPSQTPPMRSSSASQRVTGGPRSRTCH